MNGVEAKKKTIFTGLVLNMVLIDGCFRWESKVDLHSTSCAALSLCTLSGFGSNNRTAKTAK